MNTTVTEQEGRKAQLEVEVSAQEVNQAFEDTFAALGKDIRLPGFRKGRVPRPVLIQRLGREGIAAQVLEDHRDTWGQEAITKSGLAAIDVVEEPKYEGLPAEDSPFNFSVVLQLVPIPELGEYKGLEVPREEAEVEDEDVDFQVDRLREEFANLHPVSGRPAVEGDYVTVDFRGSLEGKQVEAASAEDYVLELGSGRVLPELEQGMIGMEAGSEKTISVPYPEDWPDKELAGKTAEFNVKLKEIKEKILPPLNDDFAKDVSEFVTLLELRLDIRRKLQSAKEMGAKSRFRAGAVQKAVENATVDIPEVMIARQADIMMQDYLRSLEARGVDMKAFIEATKDNLSAMLLQMRPEAENIVKTGLVLDAIAEKEQLQVTESEVDEIVKPLAEAGKTDAAQLRERLEQSGRIESIKQNLLRDKAANLIEENAVAVESPAPSTEEPQAEVEAEVSGEAAEEKASADPDPAEAERETAEE